MDSIEVISEMQRARADFHRLISGASAHDLRRRSNGNRWTNRYYIRSSAGRGSPRRR
jgi:hypothetical protein